MGAPVQDPQAVWKRIVGHPKYATAPQKEKDAALRLFKENIPGATSFLDQKEGPSRGPLEDAGHLIKQSVLNTVDAMRLSDDAVTRNIDPNTPDIMAKGFKRQVDNSFMPIQLEKVHAAEAAISDKWDRAKGIAESSKVVGEAVWEGVKQVATNPLGVAYQGLESVGNMAPSMAGTIAGSAVGGPVGAAAGAFGGGYSVEAGARFQEEVQKELTARKLTLTRENIDALTKDQTWLSPALDRSNLKAVGTAGVDALLSIGVGKLATSPTRLARSQAIAELGEDAAEEAINALTLKNLASRSVRDKVTHGLKTYGAELFSEPTSEATGQLAADKKIDMGELLAETLGSVGTSMVEKSVNTAAFGTKVAGKVAKAATTPGETRRTDGSAGYAHDAKVDEAVKNQDTSKYTDPESPDYNPSIAVNALKKMNEAKDLPTADKVANIEQAQQVAKDYVTRIQATTARLAEIREKGETQTEAGMEEATRLQKEVDADMQNLTEISQVMAAMKKTGNTPITIKQEIETKAKAEDTTGIEDTIINTYVENGAKDSEALFSGFAAMSQNPNATPAQKEYAKAAQNHHKAKRALNQAINKHPDLVHQDIQEGNGADFTGITDYRRSVGAALQKGDLAKAKEHLAALKTFAADHMTKAQVLKRMTQNVANKREHSQFDLAHMQVLAQQRGGKPYDLNHRSTKWMANLDLMHKEAHALKTAAIDLEKLIALKEPQKKAEPSTPVNKKQSAAQPTADTVVSSPKAVQGSPKDNTYVEGAKVDGVVPVPPIEGTTSIKPQAKGKSDDTVQKTGNTPATQTKETSDTGSNASSVQAGARGNKQTADAAENSGNTVTQGSAPVQPVVLSSKAMGKPVTAAYMDELSKGTPAQKITHTSILSLLDKTDDGLRTRYAALVKKLPEYLNISYGSMGFHGTPKKRAVGFALLTEAEAIEHEFEKRGIPFDSFADIQLLREHNEAAQQSYKRAAHYREANKNTVFATKIRLERAVENAQYRLKEVQKQIDNPAKIPVWSNVEEKQKSAAIWAKRLAEAEQALKEFDPDKIQGYVSPTFDIIPSLDEWRKAGSPTANSMKKQQKSKPVTAPPAETKSTIDDDLAVSELLYATLETDQAVQEQENTKKRKRDFAKLQTQTQPTEEANGLQEQGQEAQEVKPEVTVEPINIWYGNGENAQLSNLADRPFTFMGTDYISVEHAYQTNKSGEFDKKTYHAYTENYTTGTKIKSPLKAKTKDNYNLDLMQTLVRLSFEQNPSAMDALLATGNAELTHKQDKGIWKTQFPKVLMEIRSELQEQLAKEEADGLAAIEENSRPKDQVLSAAILEKTEGLVYTKPEDGRLFNFIQETFTTGKLFGVLQKFPNFFPQLGNMFRAGDFSPLEKYFKGMNLDHDAKFVMKDMGMFNKHFAGIVLGSLTDAKNPQKGILKAIADIEYRYSQPLQYLLKKDETRHAGVSLHEGVVNAMSAVAYKYLSTQASETLDNDERAVLGILGLPDDQYSANNTAFELLGDIGVSENALYDTLGKAVYQLLGIKATGKTPGDFEHRLQIALGQTVVGALERAGYLEAVNVFTGDFSEKTEAQVAAMKPKDRAEYQEAYKKWHNVGFGLTGLKNLVRSGAQTATAFINFSLADDSFIAAKGVIHKYRSTTSFYRVANKQDRETKVRKPVHLVSHKYRSTSFYRVANKQDRETKVRKPVHLVSRHSTAWQRSPEVWDRLFLEELDSRYNYSWEKRENKERLPLGQSTQKATKEQTENLINNDNKPIHANGPVMNMFMLLGFNRQLMVSGWKDPDKFHHEQELGLKSANAKLEREIMHLCDWRYNATKREGTGLDSRFYLQSSFANQGRMNQNGPINMQGSKIHRYVFSMDWTSAFRKNDAEMVARFKMAIAQSFGYEASKNGNQEGMIKALEAKLKEPAVASAIERLQSLVPHIEGNLTDDAIDKFRKERGEVFNEDLDVIVAGIQAVGSKVHALKAMVEYARFKNHKTKAEFSTNIIHEVDGIANGPTLGMLHMIPHVTPQVAAMLRASGIQFEDSPTDTGIYLKNPQSLDTYKAAGHAWGKFLAMMQDQLTESYRESLASSEKLANANAMGYRQELRRIQVAESILGDLTDEEGYLAGFVRNMTKDPTMTTMYGAGRESLVRGLTDRFFVDKVYNKDNSIYGQLNKIAGMVEAGKEEDATLALRQFVTNMQILTNLPKGTETNLYKKLDWMGRMNRADFNQAVADILNENAIIDVLPKSARPALFKQLEALKGKDSKTIRAELKTIQTYVAQEINKGLFAPNRSDVLTDGKLDPKKIRALTLSQQATTNIYDFVEKTHGKALNDAIDHLFGDLKAARVPYNRGYAISAAYYNTALATLTEHRRQQMIDAGELPIIRTDNRKSKKGEPIVHHYADMPKEEYDKINKQIDEIFPRIRTPFGGLMDIADFDRTPDYSQPGIIYQSFDNTDKRQQAISPKTSYAPTLPLLGNPGVSGAVKNIQLQDATISNKQQGRMAPILNAHDGFYGAIKDIRSINESLNRITFEGAQNYEMAEEMHTGILSAYTAFKVVKRDMTKEFPDLAQAFEDNMQKYFKAMGIGDKEFDMKLFAKDDSTTDYDRIIDMTFDQMDTLTPQITETKHSLLPTIKVVNHYNYSEGGYHVSGPHTSLDVTTGVDAQVEEGANETATEIRTSKETRSKELPQLLKDFSQPYTESKKWLPNNAYISAVKKDAEGNALRDENGDPISNPVISTSSKSPGPAALLSGQSSQGMSSNPTDYQLHLDVNQMNTVEVYDTVKNSGNKQDSAEHDTHLKRILAEVVAKVVNPAKVYLTTNPYMETSGMNIPGPNGQQVFISSQPEDPAHTSGILAQGLVMSTGEVYTHELLHAVTRAGMRMYPRIKTQIEQLYNLAQANLDYIVFLNSGIDVADTANADVVQAAKDRFDYIFGKTPLQQITYTDSATGITYTKQYSPHLEEFVALGLSNEKLLQALQAIPIDSLGPIFNKDTWSGLKGKNLYETLVNIYNRIMDLILHNYSQDKPGANVAAELERLAVQLTKAESQFKGKAFEIMEKISGAQDKLNQYGNNGVKAAFNKLKIVQTGTMLYEQTRDANSPMGELLRNIRRKIDNMHYGFAQSIATEMNGLTDRLAPLHKLINKRKQVVDGMREEITTNMIETLQQLWSRKLTKDEKTALTKTVLKLDLDVLRDSGYTMEDIQAMLNPDTVVRNQEIENIERQIAGDRAFGQYKNFFITQSRSLGHFLAQGTALEKTALLNANAIAHMCNTSAFGSLAAADQQRAAKLVDSLSSLYGMQFSNNSHLTAIHELMNTDLEGVRQVMDLHRHIKKESAEQLFKPGSMKIIKGYTKEITNDQVKLAIASPSDEQLMASYEYKRLNRVLEQDPDDPDSRPLTVYVAKHGTRANYLSGIASFTGNSAKGTDLRDRMFMHQDEDITANTAADAILTKRKLREFNRGFNDPVQPYNPDAYRPTYMVPKLSDTGRILGYRYMMNEQMKDDVLEKHNDYDAILGGMAGQVVDKVGTREINNDLINALKEIADAEMGERPSIYVAIGPHSTDQRLKDIYYMFPEKARQQIKQVWGSNTMYVAKDVLDLAFGQCKYSVVDAFMKDERERAFAEKAVVNMAQWFFRDKKITRMRQIEDVLIDLTKFAKNNLIVKSFSVTYNNFVSNMILTRMHGVSFAETFRSSREAFTGAFKYQSGKKQLDQSEIQLALAQERNNAAEIKRWDARVRMYRNEIQVNPVTPLIEAGLMPTIVDDVDTSKLKTPYPGYLDQFGEKVSGLLPDSVVTLGKHVLLTQDTKPYVFLNNMVKMTDFVGRYIMYKHYTDAKRGTDRMRHDQAVQRAISDFVDFNLPTHKMMEYGNSVGLLWFTKYFLRTLKPIAKVIKDKPFTALTSMILADVMDMANVSNSIPFVGKNPLSVFGTPWSTAFSSLDELATFKVLP